MQSKQQLPLITWGCPAYALDSMLQAGKKLPKWWVCKSLCYYFWWYFETYDSPNFPAILVAYDNWFTTVYSDRIMDMEKWEHLFLSHHKQVMLSPEELSNIQLANEWLAILLMNFFYIIRKNKSNYWPFIHAGSLFPWTDQQCTNFMPINLEHEFNVDPNTLPEDQSTEGAFSPTITITSGKTESNISCSRINSINTRYNLASGEVYKNWLNHLPMTVSFSHARAYTRNMSTS